MDAVTGPRVANLRAHGRNHEGHLRGCSVAERIAYRVADEELEELRGRREGLAEQAREVRAVVNHDRGDDAPRAAARLRELLGRRAAPIPTPTPTPTQETLLR